MNLIPLYPSVLSQSTSSARYICRYYEQEAAMNYWQGERIRLRGMEPTDAETFFQWNLDSEMGRNLDFVWPPISQALVKKQVEDGSLKSLEEDAFTWIIEVRSGQAV